MSIKIVDIGLLKPNPSNPRHIKDGKFTQLVKSIRNFPEMLNLRPIVVDSDYVVLGGNMRLKACIEAGLVEVPIIIASELTKEQQSEFIIKDNVGFGEWDWEQLANEWEVEELAEWGLDLPLDFEEKEIDAVEDDFEQPETIETDIVLGDLFEIGEHRLLCGDSTDSDAVAKLMDGNKADMVFTSPPYNANTKAGQGDIFNKKKNVKLYSDGYSDNLESSDYVNFASSVLNNCFLFTDGHIFWNVSYNANSRFEYIQQIQNHLGFLIEQICWKKSSTIPFKGSLMRDWEPIYVFSTNGDMLGLDSVNSNHWEVNNTNSQQDNHKACFPIELPSKAIKLNDWYKLIFEPFTGSGSTIVAAHQLKRKCYGMELDPKYCQVIIDRMIKLDPTLVIKRNGHPYESIS
jgi:site-specific DNA-methyltransferase (adenine-specific)